MKKSAKKSRRPFRKPVRSTTRKPISRSRSKKVAAKPRRRCTTSHPCVKGITSRQFSQWLRSS